MLTLLRRYFMCPETKGRSLEDINAQFGEKVAIHFYGATEEEKRELEDAVVADEKADEMHDHSHIVDDVKHGVEEVRIEHVGESP